MYIKKANLYFSVFLVLFIFSCSLNVKDKLNQNYSLKIETPNSKYDTLLNFELKKYNKFDEEHRNIFFLDANITFSSQETLSLKGLTPLNKMTGTIKYQLNKNDTIIKKGSISSVINYGSVSSLYGKEENQKFAQERIVKNLALKLLNKIKLIINKIEN